MVASYQGLATPASGATAPWPVGGRLKAQRLMIVGVLLVTTLVCLFLAQESLILQRRTAAADAADQVGQRIDAALGGLSSTAQIIAEAMPSVIAEGATEGAAHLLAQAVRLPSVFAAELLDASGRTLLIQHGVRGLMPDTVQFTEIGPSRNWENATLLRSEAGAVDHSLLALRAYTPVGPDEVRHQVLIVLRSTDLPKMPDGLGAAWLFSSGGGLVSRPLGTGRAYTSDRVWQAWLNVRPTQPSGHFLLPMADGVHLMLYRKMHNWPICLVIDAGLQAVPLLPQSWAPMLMLWMAALLLVGGVVRCLLRNRAGAAQSVAPGAVPTPSGAVPQPKGGRHLAGQMAHEMNNLLTQVSCDAEVAGELLPGDPAIAQIRRSMLEAVTRGADLTQRLQLIADATPVPPPRVLDVAVEILNLYDQLAALLGADRTLVLQLPSPQVPRALAMLDPAMFATALCALLRYMVAIAGSSAEFCLKLSVVGPMEERVVEVSVSDLAAGDQQASQDYSETSLAIAAECSRQTGGTLRVETSLGQVASVQLCFPAHAERRRADVLGLAATLAVPDAPGMGARILLVDDAAPVRSYIAQRLRELGFCVVEARDAEHAERISAADVDVLVTELVLNNNVDGSDLAARIRKRVAGLPVVFMSGFRNSNQTAAMACDNLTSFTRKPVNVDELRAVIDGLLAQREPRWHEAMQSRA